jgi:hypothetical protein
MGLSKMRALHRHGIFDTNGDREVHEGKTLRGATIPLAPDPTTATHAAVVHDDNDGCRIAAMETKAMSVQHQVGRGYGEIEKPVVEPEQPRKSEPGVKGMVRSSEYCW